MTLAELPYTTNDLFPAGDFAFHMRFRRGEIPAFYKNSSAHADIIAERRKWLSQDSQKYAAALPEAEPLLEEAVEVAESLGISTRVGKTPFETILNLGAAWHRCELGFVLFVFGITQLEHGTKAAESSRSSVV